MRLLLIVLFALTPAVAAAQPAMSPVMDSDPKDPTLATVLTVGSTALAAGLAYDGWTTPGHAIAAVPGFLGLVVLPSLGHFYSDEDRHAAIGTTVRGTMLVTFLWAYVDAHSSDLSAACLQGEHCDNDHHIARAVEAGSAVVFVGSVLYDLWDAHRAANRMNEKRRMALNPTFVPHAAGVSLSGSF